MGKCGRGAASAADTIGYPVDDLRAAGAAKFMFGMKTAQRGVYSAPRGKCRLSAYERLARTGFRVWSEGHP